MENETPVVETPEENASPEIKGSETIKVDAGQPEEKGDWYKNLDEDLRNNPSIQKFKDPAGLAKSYVELQKMIGKDKVVIPTDKSTPAEWDAFYAKIGRPSDINEYAVPEIETPEEIKMRPETLEAFKKKAHDLGISKKAFAELFSFQAEMNNQLYNQKLEEAKGIKSKTETELMAEWGAAYEKKVDSAQNLINTFFANKQIHPAFKVLSNDKGFVQAMADIAEKLGEDVISGTSRDTMTPSEAKKAADAMLGDSKGPLFDEMHPEHAAAVERFSDLTRMAEAGQ